MRSTNCYKLTKMPGGATVYACDEPIPHYACVACVESKNQIQTLQHVGNSQFADCPTCKVKYFIRKATTDWHE